MPKSRNSNSRTKRSTRRSWDNTISGLSEDADFHFHMGILFRVGISTMNSRRSKKSARRCQTSDTKNKSTNSSIICLEDSEEEIIPIEGADTKNIKENIRDKVDSFFKSGGLISDDEEELQLFKPAMGEPCWSKPEPLGADCVEIIEVKDDPKQINSMATEFCKETAHILENANALLDKLTKSEDKSNNANIDDKVSNTNVNNQENRLKECPICFESLAEKTIMSTKCGHLFCKECILKVATTLKKCPICKKAVNKKNIIPIYI